MIMDRFGFELTEPTFTGFNSTHDAWPVEQMEAVSSSIACFLAGDAGRAIGTLLLQEEQIKS